MATEDFLKAAHWLTDVDTPLVTQLRLIAAEVDANGITASLGNVYGVTYRSLLKRAGENIDTDEAEDFLNSL